MADTIPVPYEISESAAEDLGGTTDPDTNVPYLPVGAVGGSSPSLVVQYHRMAQIVRALLDTTGRAVRSTGGQLHIGVYPFDCPYADGNVYRYEGNTGYELTGGDNTYKVWISRATTTPTLTHGTSWPASKDDYIPIAEFVVASSAITTSDKDADMRSLAVFEGFHAATAGTGTTATAFTLDSDNAGAGAALLRLLFNRGTDGGGEDAAVDWDETNDKFVLKEKHSTGTLAKLDVAQLYAGAVQVIDANGDIVPAAISGTTLYCFGANTGSTPKGVKLAPSGSSGAPTGGTHTPGELAVDTDAMLWMCTGGGTPGTWTKCALAAGVITTAMLGDTLADKLVQISIGDASGASAQTVTIQAKDIQGNNLAEVVYVQIGVYDDADGQTQAVNATIADGGSGSIVQTVTAGKEHIFKSDSSGTIQVAVTDGTAETVYLLAAACRRSRIMDCNDIGTVEIT